LFWSCVLPHVTDGRGADDDTFELIAESGVAEEMIENDDSPPKVMFEGSMEKHFSLARTWATADRESMMPIGNGNSGIRR
jgi:hypothetical protein